MTKRKQTKSELIHKQYNELYQLTVETEREIAYLYLEEIRNIGDTFSPLDKEKFAKELIELNVKTIAAAIEIGAVDTLEDLYEILADVNYTGAKEFDDLFKQIHLDVIRPFFYSDIYRDGKTLSDRVWEYTEEFDESIRQVIAEGLAAGKSSVNLAKDLEYLVKEDSKRPSEIKDIYPSMGGKIDYNAIRLARTTINHAYQMAAVKAAARHPNTLGIRWVTSGNHGQVCQLCIEREETDQYGLGEGVFPVDEVPLDHPNGMCTLVQEPIQDTDGLIDDLLDWIDGGDYPEFDEWEQSIL